MSEFIMLWTMSSSLLLFEHEIFKFMHIVQKKIDSEQPWVFPEKKWGEKKKKKSNRFPVKIPCFMNNIVSFFPP